MSTLLAASAIIGRRGSTIATVTIIVGALTPSARVSPSSSSTLGAKVYTPAVLPSYSGSELHITEMDCVVCSDSCRLSCSPESCSGVSASDAVATRATAARVSGKSRLSRDVPSGTVWVAVSSGSVSKAIISPFVPPGSSCAAAGTGNIPSTMTMDSAIAKRRRYGM
ncbi:hypothetical protein SDC9_168297 [bioreactor metagenome]|uniref:Uncharacterized protein n=1 Tax=bioreactor metagenome TaxID=1076179 RepID=A0A645G240_9ZZZZ